MEFTASGDNGQGQDPMTPLSGWRVYERKSGSGLEMDLAGAESLPGVVAILNLLESGLSNEGRKGLTNREELLRLERRARMQGWATVAV